MEANPNEMVAWQVSVGKGHYSEFNGALALLTDIQEHAAEFMAAVCCAWPPRTSDCSYGWRGGL